MSFDIDKNSSDSIQNVGAWWRVSVRESLETIWIVLRGLSYIHIAFGKTRTFMRRSASF